MKQLTLHLFHNQILQSYGVHNPSSLTAEIFLKYKLSEIENDELPWLLRLINVDIVTDSHHATLTLQAIKDVVLLSPHSTNTLSLLGEEINSLMTDYKQILRDAHKISRKLNQSVQRNLYEKNYDKLIKTVDEFMKTYPLFNVVHRAVIVVKKVIPHYNGELSLQLIIANGCEVLQLMTPDYHSITTLTLPSIELMIRLHKKIISSLLMDHQILN